MRKFVFILGGARSGKSSYAVRLAEKLFERVVFIATATPLDAEMQRRIKKHKAARPKSWTVIEESRDISSLLPMLNDKHEAAIIDCLGLLVSNLLADGLQDSEIERRIKALVAVMHQPGLSTTLVSNEVGTGIVPDNPLSRRFRDLVGLANQMAAEKADEVILMQAGIPVYIKGGETKREH